MISALSRAAMRAILMFQQEVMDKVTRQCPQTTTILKRKESRSGIEHLRHMPFFTFEEDLQKMKIKRTQSKKEKLP